MFEEPTDMAWMDYWTDHEFCCTEEMSISGYCSVVDRLIIPSNLPGAFTRTLSIKPDSVLPLYADDTISHHDIKSTGIYILFMASCDPASTPVRVDGKIESIDPYGYLPADLYENLPFYGALSCMYSIVGITWLIMCAAYRDQIISLQVFFFFSDSFYHLSHFLSLSFFVFLLLLKLHFCFSPTDVDYSCSRLGND